MASPMRHATSWPNTSASRKSRPVTGANSASAKQRRHQRRGRMDRRGHVGIAKVEHIGAGGVEERRAERIDALAPADQCRLLAARERGERLQQGLESLGAAAGQRRGKQIHQGAFRLVADVGRQIIPPHVHGEFGQLPTDSSIARHDRPREIEGSIGCPAAERKRSRISARRFWCRLESRPTGKGDARAALPVIRRLRQVLTLYAHHQ